ncbi:MAG: hypothetical protein AAF329_16290 [Cyanobacteria bacterium P01_A01_bin.17]
MAGRSLQLSQYGQQQARQALIYLGLTQKAIAYERAIASWSTVNRFFNGKPVDRFIFQEICEELELDWQDVIATGRDETPSDDEQKDGEIGRGGDGENRPPTTPKPYGQATDSLHLLTAVQAQATAAREALTPRILERISRQVVRQKYLPAITRGVRQGQPCVVAIIGPAGYGKSTILGDLYDELVAADNVPWVGLVLCSSLSLSTGYLGFMSYGFVAATFTPLGGAGTRPTEPSQHQQDMVAAAIGQSLCGETRSVVYVVQELTATQGQGVLLIDTLDLVINRDFVITFGRLLRQVVATGTAIAFTCRDYEYTDYLEPPHQKLPGLAQVLDRYAVPNFTTAEIRAAATAFFRQLAPLEPQRGEAFAENVLALSADNRSLREILENPLLLALLCDLFGREGNVPPDLTVSKLYQRYWREKVVFSRVDQSHFAPLALAKERVCLQIAEQLFARSPARLQESFYQDELGIDTLEAIAALTDLLSEGVLTQLASGKLHFFHQTLLEYAIAYWLTRQSAAAARSDFFEQLKNPGTQGNRAHWLPVLRQLLAIVEEAEFEAGLRQLDLNNMGIFGAVAYAAVSRDRPDALRQLLPIALQMGETHQQRLRQALAAAPRQLIETVWDVLLTLMTQAEHVTASNTVQMVGELLARWWRSLRDRLPAALMAVAARTVQPHDQFPDGYDDRPQLLGWLLQPCWPLIQAQPTNIVLRALQQQVSLLGHGSCAQLIASHHDAAPALQHALLAQLLTEPVPRYEDIKAALVQWLASLLPAHLAMADFPLGDRWEAFLYETWPKGWGIVLTLAVAHWAGRDRPLFTTILEDGLFGPTTHLGANLMVIKESLLLGAAPWLAPHLTQLPAERAEQMNFACLAKGITTMAVGQMSPADQEAIAQWLSPYLSDHGVTLWTLLNSLADAAPTARAGLMTITPKLPQKIRRQAEIQLLRFQPIAQHPPIATVSKPDQRFLLSLYQSWAGEDPAALETLLATALGHQNDAAVTASRLLSELAPEKLSTERLLPLVKSSFVGVKVNVLTAIATRSAHQPIAAAALTEVAIALAAETNPTVGRLYCDLMAEWVHQQQRVLPPVLNTLTAIVQRLVLADAFEGGMGRSLVVALKRMARSRDRTLDVDQLCELVRLLLTHLHLIQIKNGESEVIDVLCAVYRLRPDFLATVLEQAGTELLQRAWFYNLSALIKAIGKVEGAQSPLLDQVLQWYGDTPEIRSLVLGVRGV